MINQVPNLNHYPVNPNDERFGFLPFLGGLTVGALAGGGFGGRPCCAPVPFQPFPVVQPVPLPQPVFIQQPQFQPIQTLPATVQGSNQFFIR